MSRKRCEPLTPEWLKAQTVEDSNGCWIWQRALNHDGYGAVAVERKSQRTHRVMYQLTHSDFDESLHVLHDCDVRACINPSHLYPGTQQQNVIDMVTRGRVANHKHEANPNAKLTIEQVRAIQMDERPIRVVARDYPIGPSQVQRIKHQKHWQC